jgi:hypothetical protein
MDRTQLNMLPPKTRSQLALIEGDKNPGLTMALQAQAAAMTGLPSPPPQKKGRRHASSGMTNISGASMLSTLSQQRESERSGDSELNQEE